MLHLRHIHNKIHHHKHKKHLVWIDYIVITISLLGPIFTIPQLLIIWGDRNASGISITTWASYTFFSLVWLSYGLIHRDKIIILSNTIWLTVNGLVVLGAIIYGGSLY